MSWCGYEKEGTFRCILCIRNDYQLNQFCQKNAYNLVYKCNDKTLLMYLKKYCSYDYDIKKANMKNTDFDVVRKEIKEFIIEDKPSIPFVPNKLRYY